MILSNDTITMKPLYKITPYILAKVASISEKLGEIKAARLHRPPTELRKRNRIRTIHSSLVIEGNTLTFDQVTALLEKKRVIAPLKDITEVKNAIRVYENIGLFDPFSIESLCEAHRILMDGLVENAGRLRNKSVGIMKGKQLAHVAPSGTLVKLLLNDLFGYLENDDEILLVKSCVFHYEFEFIHPFLDGNGRMGRLWQSVILMKYNPVFEYLPVESLIKENQEEYYRILAVADRQGESTIFVEFMLRIVEESLEELLQSQNVTLTERDRIALFKDYIADASFTRKDYLRYFKELSTATASRDLKEAVDSNLLRKEGEKSLTRYTYII
ncbi:MAG: Fic family protein [Parabacteroides sp.]|nr:Fic family protein [Parabacteroides sp.]